MEVLIAVLGVVSALIGLVSVILGRRKVHEVTVRTATPSPATSAPEPVTVLSMEKVVAEVVATSRGIWDNHAIALMGYCVVVGMLSAAVVCGGVGGLLGWLGFANVLAFGLGGLVVGGLAALIANIVNDPVIDPTKEVAPWALIGSLVGGGVCLWLVKAKHVDSSGLGDWAPGDGAFWGALVGAVIGFLVGAAIGYSVVLKRPRG